MEKARPAQKKALRYVLAFFSFAIISALIVLSVAAFRSVYGVYFSLPVLFAAGFVFFALFASNFVIMTRLGKSDHVSVILVNVVMLLTIIATVLCLHFGRVYAMPVVFLALLLGTDFDKRVALSSHLSCIASVAVCMALFFFSSEGFTYVDVSLQLITLVTNVVMGSMLVYLIRPFQNRLRVIFSAVLIVFSYGLLGFVASAVAGVDILLMTTVGVSLIVGGVISIVAYCFMSPIFEHVFNLNTGLRLMELCSFDQPLLKELEEKAPGTFNHSLTVANISERAAYAIGENPNLAKAAALFHDVGKMENPEFFTENQTDGYNPHDELIPEASVKMITRHTEAGAKLLAEKGFPPEIVSAALQHHGDSSVGYFYHKAQNITEGTLEEKGYTYLGPKPQTKINAIIMIADIAEAATRSVRPSTREELEALVDKLIQQKMGERQFDECPITIAELNKVKEAVVTTLMGVHHERISYNLGAKK